ncbi:MAG TPA: NAD(P)H-dependent glycerol-3-phosphate dehydrogenase [Dissulfurispiraceae bacterium]|nr:NAD(P)H-dependent glycerol-3-phosphate dehydrogenase [Dissulfurispiraceae bacterium]
MSYISVIGGGCWGTTLAALLANKGYDVTLWTLEAEVAGQINDEGVNASYLPGVVLPESLRATNDFREAAEKARYVLNAVPTQYIRTVFSSLSPHLTDEAIIVSASKGIEIGTLLTPSRILGETTGRPVSVLSGPSFAREVIERLPTGVTLATEDKMTGLILQEVFNTDYFRVYTHDDVIGVEIGGALKNVIAIASGISDGMGLGYNARATLITRGLAEIRRLGAALQAREVTFSGLSGLGDLVLTCTAGLSRNYTVGHRLGQGETLQEITGGMKQVAEGVTTTHSAFELSKKHGIEMPITEQVYLALYQGKPPREAVTDLMNRALKSEFHGY